MKGIILSILDYLRMQVENDKCSSSEMQSICNLMTKELNVTATVDDLAAHFKTSHSNVRNVLVKYPNKPYPKRQYNMMKFIGLMPNKWLYKQHVSV